MASNFWSAARPPAGTAINPSHPLSLGLVLHWPMNEGGGSRINNAVAPGYITLPQACRFVDRGVRFATSGATQLDVVGLVPPGQNNFAIAFHFWIESLPGGNDSGVGYGLSGAGGDGVMLGWDATSIECRRTSDGGRIVGGPAFPSFSVWHHVAVTRRGTTNRLYLDGAQVATTTTSGDTVVPTSVSLFTNINTSFPDLPPTGTRIDAVGIWNRALSAEDIGLLATRPYCMYQAPVWARGFLPAVEAPATPAGKATPKTYELFGNWSAHWRQTNFGRGELEEEAA